MSGFSSSFFWRCPSVLPLACERGKIRLAFVSIADSVLCVLSKETYGVADGELLFLADNETTSLGGVQGALAAHDSLLGSSATAGLASNRDSVPVRHLDGCIDESLV